MSMISRSFFNYFAGLTAACLCFGLMPTVSAEGESPEKFALIIGIDDYIHGIPGRRPDGYPGGDLSGCVNDANSIEQLLIERGFPKEHITKLLDAAATREGILKAFDDLVEKVEKNPNAIVVFSYAGHGSQATDTNGDEEDGLDETLVPADTAMNDQGDESIEDITDDEIEKRFSRMAKKTKNITFILDSCHSGTGTREIRKVAKTDVTVRNLEEDKLRPKHKMEPAPVGKRSTKPDSDNGLLARSTDYVTISGCRSDQESGETLSLPRHGVMTDSLLAALEEMPADATYRQIYENLRGRALKNPGAQGVKNAPQEPQIEGDLDRVFLGEAGNRGDRSFRVLSVKGRNVTIPVGRAGTVMEGTQVALYGPNEKQLSGKRGLITTARISTVGASSSMFVLPKDYDLELIKKAQVVIVTPNFGSRSLSIALDTGSKSALSKQFTNKFQKQLKNNPVLKLNQVSADPFSGKSGDWQLCVTNRNYKDFKKLIAEGDAITTRDEGETPSDDALVSYVSLPSGAPLYNFFVNTKDDDSSDEVVKLLERKLKQENLIDLANLRSPLKGKIKVSFVDENDKEFPAEAQAGAVHIPIGANYKFKVTNESTLDVYVNVLLVGTRGGIHLLYEGKDKLPSGKSFTTKSVTAEGPIGKDTYKFIVTTKKAPLDFLEQDGLEVRARAGVRGDDEGKEASPLVGLLKNNLGYGVRDISRSNPQPDEWDAISRNVIVDNAESKRGAIEASSN